MFYRGRRLRKTPAVRSLVRETRLHPSELVYPIFVQEGENIKEEISSLPGQFRYSPDRLEEVVAEMRACGVRACLLFGIPAHKDACGSSAWEEYGVVQTAIRRLRSLDSELYIIADVCMCEYTSHGHCGVLGAHGEVLNDETLPHLAQIALSYARAGVDMVAPSDMMDGRIAALREALDGEGFYDLPIMGYSAKYASSFYGPFRQAAGSAPSFGDRKAYQMDYANANEAMREMQADWDEGADILMVKPAMAYLDILRMAADRFDAPLAAYQVSGEYAMLKHAVAEGLMHADVMNESLIAIKRAGASVIITYHALDYARAWKEYQG